MCNILEYLYKDDAHVNNVSTKELADNSERLISQNVELTKVAALNRKKERIESY